MTAVNRLEESRFIIDWKDFQNAITGGTGSGLVVSGITTAATAAFSWPLAALSLAVFSTNVLGHYCAREVVVGNKIETPEFELFKTVLGGVDTRDGIIATQASEIRHLQLINSELQKKLKVLQDCESSFQNLNTQHAEVLKEQEKQIEENGYIIGNLKGLLQGYQQRKDKLLDEVKKAREERDIIKQEIKALLVKQKKVNEELSKSITKLGDLVNSMNKV